MSQKKRYIPYLDILRIVATVMVVFRHTAAYNWNTAGITGGAWNATVVTISIAQCAVPLFVMISGALFLDNEKPLTFKKLLIKNVLPIVTALTFWSLGYSALVYHRTGEFSVAVRTFVEGYYHLWYLYMLIPLYLIVPILRRITESKRMTEYFIIIGIALSFVLPRILLFCRYFDVPKLPALMQGINTAHHNMFFTFTGGYTVYFMLGFYIHKYVKVRLQPLLCLGCVVTAVLTFLHTNRTSAPSIAFLDNHSLPVFCTAVGLFCLAKLLFENTELSERGVRVLRAVSKMTFGIYLVHPYILDKVATLSRFADVFNAQPWIMAAVAAAVVAVSFVISLVLNYVPIVKKYLV